MRIRSGTEPARSISTTGRLPARTDESSTGLRLLGGATHAPPRPGRCVLDCDPELRQTNATLHGSHSLRARIAQRSDVGGRCGRCLVAESVPSGLEKSLPPLERAGRIVEGVV